jgi:hypothetical protein
MASRRLETTQAQLQAWPGGADVAVALTFDVDAESAWLGAGHEYASRLTTLSQAGSARHAGWEAFQIQNQVPHLL